MEFLTLEYQFRHAQEDIHLPTHAVCRYIVNFCFDQTDLITMGYFNENIYSFNFFKPSTLPGSPKHRNIPNFHVAQPFHFERNNFLDAKKQKGKMSSDR